MLDCRPQPAPMHDHRRRSPNSLNSSAKPPQSLHPQFGKPYTLNLSRNTYHPAPPPEQKKRGRPRLYGEKVAIKSLFDNPEQMQAAASPVYGEHDVQVRFYALDLLWRPVGILIRFVAPVAVAIVLLNAVGII